MDYFHFNWGQNNSSGGFYEMGNFAYSEDNHAEIKIMPIPNHDIKVSQMISPSSQTFTESSTLKVLVENYSLTPQTNIPISYSVNNGAVINEIISTTIPALSSLEYEFSTAYDFSLNPGIYSMKIFSNHPLDAYRYNDTIHSVIENISCTQIPYSTGFENAAEKLGWIIEDANNDGNKWQFSGFAPNYVFYSSNDNQADDWLFSRCLELETNKLYKLKFDYRSTGIYWKQNLEIWLGSGIESLQMNMLLDAIYDFNNPDYETKEILFTVPANNSYYLGFKCISQPEMLVMVMDNISITELAEPDFEICSLLSPSSNCELSSETIRVKVRNLCSQTLSNIPISYILDDTVSVTEIITNEILPGEIVFFDFSNQADISSHGNHTIKVYSSLDSDSNRENDTVFVSVDNIAASYAPYFCGFENPDEFEHYLIENNNNDNRSWNYVASGGNSNPACVKYEYNDFLAADDWLITKCMYLENNYIYKLKFAYKIEDASWPEKLEVKMSDMQSSNSMDVLLLDLPSMTNISYETAEVSFPIPTDGFYYFGFHCYSDMQMFNLYLDDISIDIKTINRLDDHGKSDFLVYPNPTYNNIYLRDNSSTFENSLVNIYDAWGGKVFEKEMSNSSLYIDISHLKKRCLCD